MQFEIVPSGEHALVPGVRLVYVPYGKLHTLRSFESKKIPYEMYTHKIILEPGEELDMEVVQSYIDLLEIKYAA